jgi:SWI/SNF-related matrix-associated actin-dependent regulator of chromatin subfamily A3
MLALILATKSDSPRDFSKSTLIGNKLSTPKIVCPLIIAAHIVTPLSVLSNWEKQIEDHCSPDSLTTCIYYGNSRSLSSEELKKYDVVITTYQTVAGEHSDTLMGGPSKKKKKKEQVLFNIQWKVSLSHLPGRPFESSVVIENHT